MTAELTLQVHGPFDLAASIRFLEGFAPAAYGARGEATLDLAFAVEGDWRTVGVRVRQDGGGRVHALVVPAPPAPDAGGVVAQLERILSLDVDGTGFAAVGSRDPVVGSLQERYRGLRPVNFWSPYEAACWAVIGHRVRIVQAAAVKQRIADEFGVPVELPGRRLHAFPVPGALLDAGAALDGVRGLVGRKAEWLRGIAAAALDGRLDAARLRALPREQALRELQGVPGIGPFSAELVLLRGAGDPDAAPQHEQRLRRAVASLYGPAAELADVSEAWRPYRTWVSVLLRTWLEDETCEIAGRGGAATRSASTDDS